MSTPPSSPSTPPLPTPRSPEHVSAPPSPVDPEGAREYALTRGHRLGAPTAMTPTEDGAHVLFLRSGARDAAQTLFETDVATGETREILTPAKLAGAGADDPSKLTAAERARRERLRITTSGFTSFECTKDGSRVVVTAGGRLYLHERATGASRELATGDSPFDPRLSPDGRELAYVRGQDVYTLSLDDPHARERAVTRGGTELVSHGIAEFVAQEELDRTRGFWWSPDGKQLLVEEVDNTPVEELYIADPAHPERAPDRLRYPRAGRANAKVRLFVVDAHGSSLGAPRFLRWDRDAFPYLATVVWSKGSPITLYVLDRAQRRGLLLRADPHDGSTTTLLEDTDDVWLDKDPSVPRWLPDGSGFLWSSEKSGRRELELHDASGKLARVVAPATVGYVALLAIDEDARVAYVHAAPDPVVDEVWSVSLDGRAPPARFLAEGSVGSVLATFGKGHAALAWAAATPTTLPRFFARRVAAPADSARPIPSVTAPLGYALSVELTTVGPDATRVAIVRPRGFVAGAAARYPLVDAAYGGPGWAVVGASGLGYVRAQWMADVTQSIVVAIDARGTPRRDRAWARALQNAIGRVPLEGHVAAIDALAQRVPEIDRARVGIYGWSFGGYLAALAAIERPDVFKVAVAGAPPADWRDYDTCYTERYLGDPATNARAYDEASLLVAAAHAKTVAPLLVVHGTADDNVYFTHSLKLADALMRAGLPFELVPVAGVTHQLFAPDTAGPVWTRMAEFLRTRLHFRDGNGH